MAVLAIEGIAVIFVGPASLLAVYAIAKGKSYSYILQFALSLVQFYGSSLYFITAFLEGDKFASTRYFYYSYFIAQGGTWLLFPALIMIRCWKRICAACTLPDHKSKVYWLLFHILLWLKSKFTMPFRHGLPFNNTCLHWSLKKKEKRSRLRWRDANECLLTKTLQINEVKFRLTKWKYWEVACSSVLLFSYFHSLHFIGDFCFLFFLLIFCFYWW